MMRAKPRIIHDEYRNETYIPPEIEAEMDAYDRLVEDIRAYVADCVEYGIEPDGWAFCAEHRIDYGGEGGTLVEKLITEELAK